MKFTKIFLFILLAFFVGNVMTVSADEVTGSVTVTVTAVTKYTLTITKAGTGTGVVTSVPAGISCGVDCSEVYASRTAVTMTATPDATSTFAGWSGGIDCEDGSVTMNANKSCTATFNLTTVDSCGTGSGATPILTEPTTNPKACNPGKYINSPSDTTTSGLQAWKWSCGSVRTCKAPKYGCTTITDTNYDANGPSNLYRCANTCKNGYTNYPTCTIPSTGTCFDGIQNQSEFGLNAESGIDTGGICAKGTLTISPASCIIDLNKSTCTVTGATWTTTKATDPVLIDGNMGNTLSHLANNKTPPLKVWVAHPYTVFNLKDDVLDSKGQHTKILDSKTVNASCIDGTTWDGSSNTCKANVIPVGNIGVSLQIIGNPTITLPENSSTLQWMTWGNPDSCIASDGSTGWSGSKNLTSGPPHTQKMTNLTAGVYTYNIKCIKGTEQATASVTLTVINKYNNNNNNVCPDGATNPPTCTTDNNGYCINGAINPPACTDFGTTYDGSADQCLESSLSVKYNNLDIPSTKIPYNSKVFVSWSSTNVCSCSCSYSDAINTGGTSCGVGPNGGPTPYILRRDTTYTVSCTGIPTKSQTVLVDKIDIRYIEQ